MITDQLTPLIQDQLAALLSQNGSAVAEELANAPEGKLSVSFGSKLQLQNGRLYVTSSIGFARKFTDATETESVDIDDPKQPKLALDKA